MADARKPLHLYLTPNTWPVWAGLGLLRVICWLPAPMALGIGRAVGRLALRFAGTRAAVVRRNLELAFPELTLI